jgi:hypothetical protein
MITLTPAEVRLRGFLAKHAWSASRAPDPQQETFTYARLAAEVDPDNDLGWKQGHPRYSRLITGLYHVNNSEAEHGRPMIGAFAVSTRSSIEGFAEMARREPGRTGEDYEIWQSEISSSAAYWGENWDEDSTEDGAAGRGALSDAQFDAIMGELSKIKRMLRTLMNG